jgi:hypothetical protein
VVDYDANVVKKFRDHENRIERLEKIESLSLSDELAHALGAGIPASAGVALDASRHDHIHEITASDNPGAKVSLLQTDANGHLTVVQLNTTANHTTTTLTDHLGEHTGAHSVVADNDITMTDAKNIILNTTTGTKIGTATNQKLGFYNASPVVQQLATTGLGEVLSNLGLRAAGTAFPITTSGATTLTGLNIKGQGAPDAEGTGVITVHLADMLTGIVTGTPNAARIYTLDTGANIDAGMTIGVDQAFEWALININTTAANIITLAGAAGHTIVGSLAIPANSATTGGVWGSSSALLRTRKTAANTFITYRIG